MYINNVCKHNNSLAYTSIGAATLMALGEHAHSLTELDCRFCSFPSSTDLTSLARGCSQLRTLRLSRCEINDTHLAAIGRYCSALIDLDISYTYVTDYGIIALANGICRQLQSLSVVKCNVTTIGLQALYATRPDIVIER
jgi:hypothetical protein